MKIKIGLLIMFSIFSLEVFSQNEISINLPKLYWKGILINPLTRNQFDKVVGNKNHYKKHYNEIDDTEELYIEVSNSIFYFDKSGNLLEFDIKDDLFSLDSFKRGIDLSKIINLYPEIVNQDEYPDKIYFNILEVDSYILIHSKNGRIDKIMFVNY